MAAVVNVVDVPIGGNGRCYEWCLEEDENEQPKEARNQRRTITVAGQLALGGALGLLPHGDGIEVVGIAGGDGRYLFGNGPFGRRLLRSTRLVRRMGSAAGWTTAPTI